MKRILYTALALILLLTASCTDIQKQTDILTLKPIEKGRTPITVLVKYAFSINAFEKAVEETFQDIDIVQVNNYTEAVSNKDYLRRLRAGDIPDMVMTWPLETGEQYWGDRLLDLSSMNITEKYNKSMLQDISCDGKLYYLPGPSQIRGLAYNKTLFEEKGWTVPKNFDEFVSLCKTIESTGIRALQLSFKNAEVFDTAFCGFNFAQSFAHPEDVRWLEEYNEGNGYFAEHFMQSLKNFEYLIQQGVFKPEDLENGYVDRENMIFNRECAMISESSWVSEEALNRGLTDKFAIMPFFSPGENQGRVQLYPVCYIGLNKEVPNDKKKYELVKKLMEYISTPEGQNALMGDTGAMFSPLSGMPTPNMPEVQDLKSALESGRYAIFPTLKRSQNALRSGLAGMLSGTMSINEVCEMVDKENANPPAQNPVVLGKATKNFSLIDTGSFLTDAMREWSGCEIALFLDNGKDGRDSKMGIVSTIYEGEITTDDVSMIMPTPQRGEVGQLCRAQITGTDLIDILEYSIDLESSGSGWFYYFSGLKMSFNPTQTPGNRIKKITLADGSKIDPARVYSVAIMDKSVPDDKMQSCGNTGVLIRDIFSKAIVKKQVITPSGDGRFTIVN